MKRNYFLLCALFLLGIGVQINAQVDPGTTNLKHQWTFDNGSLVDAVGNITGTIVGQASVANNALVATNGYMDMPAAEIGMNAYPELAIEIWCTSTGQNTGWTMLSFFGETVNNGGRNCTFLSIARGDNQTMATLETNVWNGATGPEYDDGKLHHFVYTVNATNITLFIDGAQVSTATLAEGNTIANISPSLAYLGRGGWTADPNWIGSYHKFSIYNKALSADEVLYLYQDGAEENPVLLTTATNLVFDENYPAQSFNVTGANLSSDISITTPAGISIINMAGNPITSLPAVTTDLEVVAMWNAQVPVDGDIVFSSGSTEYKVHVKTASDASCFVRLYEDIPNLLEDVMGMNSLSQYGGWGAKEIVSIINDPANVYCGAASIKVGNGSTTCAGSLDIKGGAATILQPNTTYKGRMMVKTIGGYFHVGVDAGPNVEFNVDTNGEWAPFEFMFTTGATIGNNMYFNNCGCTGLTAYVDNFELYVAPDPIITTSISSKAFDPEYKEAKFTVTSSNLSDDITINAPAGITVAPTTLPAESAGEEVTITWDGTTPVDGNMTLTSGEKVVNVLIKTVNNSNTACFTPLYADKVNLNADVFMNDAASFGGWGGKSIVSVINSPDSVYCGSHSARIFISGSVDVPLTGKLNPNTTYKSRAMIRTFGGKFQMGAFGYDALVNADVTDSIDTNEEWMPFEFEFTTAETLGANHGMFINNWGRTGKRAFIDNWEIYEAPANSLKKLNEDFANVYIQNGRIVAEFNLDTASDVEFSIFSVQGSILSNETKSFEAGKNRQVLNADLPSGMYLVRFTQSGKTGFRKIVK